ncbi:TadE family protein [Sellimonas sp.]|uniref:TadE family protein n=1 Tax=Sellimonas sp. TaxID=2021466 RepID=UPI0013021E7C|nr:TadE family protein [Sellimonas sp.]
MVRKKYQRGSFTVEAAILTSIILFILYGIILILFYYHDKNILTGAAYETAAVAARKNSMEPPFQEEDIEKLLKERISGKMIFFRGAEVQSECQNNYVWISVQASRNIMRIKAEVTSAVTEPQKKIRDIRKLEKIPQESDGK